MGEVIAYGLAMLEILGTLAASQLQQVFYDIFDSLCFYLKGVSGVVTSSPTSTVNFYFFSKANKTFSREGAKKAVPNPILVSKNHNQVFD